MSMFARLPIRKHRRIAVVASWIACVAALAAADDDDARFPKPYNSQPEDVRFTPPQQALAGMKVPDGFQVRLFASEPDVQQPIAIATDHRGRLWVAENYTYAERELNYDTKLRDRIVILEDVNHDGRFDRRTVFWDRASKLTSIEIGFGGVWALCSPHLLFNSRSQTATTCPTASRSCCSTAGTATPCGTTSSTGSAGAPTAGCTDGTASKRLR